MINHDQQYDAVVVVATCDVVEQFTKLTKDMEEFRWRLHRGELRAALVALNIAWPTVRKFKEELDGLRGHIEDQLDRQKDDDRLKVVK